MRIAGHSFDVLSPQEAERLHAAALRILDEMGMEIQERSLLDELAATGLPVNFDEQRVRFPRKRVEQFLAEAGTFDWDSAKPHLSASAGVYHSLYHDPESGKLVPWTEKHLADYFAVARTLPHVGGAHMLGCRLEVPAELEPLYERLYCWKLGASEGGSIYRTDLCPYLLEIYQARAESLDRGLGAMDTHTEHPSPECQSPECVSVARPSDYSPRTAQTAALSMAPDSTPRSQHHSCQLKDIFRASVYLAPMLKLGRHEAAQVAFFRKHDLRVNIGGGMGAMGANLPVTHAGAVTLNLAEQLALNLLDRVLNGSRDLHLGGSVSVLDLKTAIRPFGRPEMAIANLMLIQMARRYRAAYAGHAGLSDAKLPSTEAGAQKALTAIPTLLAGGNVWVDAGLLSIDEVCSPVQMCLDDEFLGALSRFVHEFDVTEETIGLDAILAAGPGGNYLDAEQTLKFFRDEHWQPGLWSRQMLRPWMADGAKLDADRAREKVLDLARSAHRPAPLAEGLEREIRRIVDKAGADLASTWS